MSESVVTTLAKRKMLKARAGLAPLPRIVGMAFGDGAKDDFGGVIAPNPDQTTLHNELLRKEIDGYKEINELTYRYTCTLDIDELGNKFLNELALYDAEGDLVAIETFLPKGKDDDQEMGFEVDDMF